MTAIALPSRDNLAEMTDRIHTAILTVSILPGDGPRGFFSTWPAYRHEHWDWGNELNQRTEGDITRRFIAPPKFAATPKQVDDCLPALRLIDGIDRELRHVVVLRAFQEWNDWHGGWRLIGDVLGISHTEAAKRHHMAILYAYQRDFLAQKSQGRVKRAG